MLPVITSKDGKRGLPAPVFDRLLFYGEGVIERFSAVSSHVRLPRESTTKYKTWPLRMETAGRSNLSIDDVLGSVPESKVMSPSSIDQLAPLPQLGGKLLNDPRTSTLPVIGLTSTPLDSATAFWLVSEVR
jgi:hypothetical protein